MEPYSHSSFGSFDQCPKAFEFKYVQKLPEAFSTIEQHMGRCVHAAINDAYAARLAGTSFSEAKISSCYDEHWNGDDLEETRVVKRGMSRQDYHADGRTMLRSFHSRVYDIDRSDSILLEHRFQVEVGKGRKKYTYTGVIDRVEKDASGAAAIVDFKTGKSVPDPRSDLQLRSYALFAIPHIGVEKVELRFEDLRGMTRACAMMGRHDLPTAAARVISKVEQIEAERSFPARPSILCDWCGYNDRCPSRMGKGAGFPARRWSRDEEEETRDTCPRCGSDLAEKNGKRGTFIGCTGFPACRYTRDDW